MTTTDLERRRGDVTLFNGAGPAEMIDAATDVATRFSDIVKKQRMFKRIGDRDHILIEAWQTVGSLTGVFATEAGGVVEIPWPNIWPLSSPEPPEPGPEPRNRQSAQHAEWEAVSAVRKAWEHHKALLDARAIGKAFGFTAAFKAVKNGEEVGWGEGRVDRTERTWASRDDYAIASMAQTRGQSRALGAPLRFIVKLAGYEPTLPDENFEQSPAAPASTAPWGPVADDEQMQQAADYVRELAAPLGVDAEKFILAMGQHFDGVPVATVTMLKGLVRYIQAAADEAEVQWPHPAPPEAEATSESIPDAEVGQ